MTVVKIKKQVVDVLSVPFKYFWNGSGVIFFLEKVKFPYDEKYFLNSFISGLHV